MAARDTRGSPRPWVFAALLVAGLFVGVDLRLGVDYRVYMEATRSWLARGEFYPAEQLLGPYDISSTPILYPPNGTQPWLEWATARWPHDCWT